MLDELTQQPIDELLLALRGVDSERRQNAVVALARSEAPGVIEALAIAARHVDWETRSAAIFALGERGEPQALSIVREHLWDRDRSVRTAAAEALEKFGEAGIGPLCDGLRSKDYRVRESAANALIRLADRVPTSSLRAAIAPLRALPRAWTLETEESIASYKSALETIERVTRRYAHLPVPSPAPGAGPETLPLPAASAGPGSDGLPIPTAEVRSRG
jgi:HEAT repeat protein